MKLWLNYNLGKGWHVVVGRSLDMSIRYDQQVHCSSAAAPQLTPCITEVHSNAAEVG